MFCVYFTQDATVCFMATTLGDLTIDSKAR